MTDRLLIEVILMPVAQLVALRNLKNGVTVLTPDRKDPGNYLEFQATGDPGGADIQYVSEEVAATPACVKAIMHGVLELERDTLSPDVAQAFQRQMDVAKIQRERAEVGITQTIDRPENRDLVGETCVGPGDRAGALCGATVAVRDRAVSDSAPLCTRHEDLAMHYVRVEDNSYNPDGTSKKGYRWLRTHFDKREREQV